LFQRKNQEIGGCTNINIYRYRQVQKIPTEREMRRTEVIRRALVGKNWKQIKPFLINLKTVRLLISTRRIPEKLIFPENLYQKKSK